VPQPVLGVAGTRLILSGRPPLDSAWGERGLQHPAEAIGRRQRPALVYGALVSEDRRVVVVGSGPPGAAAALFLANAGADVLLLEAGSERSAFGLTLRIRGFTALKYRKPLTTRRDVTATSDPDAQLFEDVAPGGLTNHWSCAVPRFSDEDFADAERAGEAYAWPFAYRDLAPWYDQVEPLLHIAGSARDEAQLPAGKVRHAWDLGSDWESASRAARGIGRTLTTMSYAYGAATTLTFSGTVFNSFVRLVRPAQRAKKLSVRFDARVVKLEWSAAKRRVTAVVFRDARTGSEERVPCAAVVLAAGAIASAQILLQSANSDFPDGLGNTHGVLGRYLHDHPLGKLVVDLGRRVHVLPPAYLTRPTLNNAPPLYVAACMQWSGTANLVRSVLERHPGQLSWVGYSVFGTMAPTLEQFVALDPKRKNADGSSAITLNVNHPPEARQALDAARDAAVSVLDQAGLSPRLRVWNVEKVGDSKHFGGTCRMHASERYGMSNGWARLHAVPNVAVVDSAAFTTGPEKNPVLTAMAVAARAADRLAGELKSGDL